STIKDGTAARVTVSSVSCGSIDLIANKFMPTGGVITDISILITMKMPNQMGSMPMVSAMGKNTGTVISMIEITSRKHPITNQIRANISMTAHCGNSAARVASASRSEEHTSELQSRENLVCRLLLEKTKGQ